MPITFQGGLLPPVRTKPRAKLAPHIRAIGAAPASVNWYGNVTTWPMFLNNQLGDCTIAMEAHNIQNASTYGDGAIETVTDNDVLTAYERFGYRPGHPETDQGAVLQDVYNDWRKNGLGGHKILAFAEVDVSDVEEVKTAINAFGGVGLGLVVDQTMMDDFNAGQGWTRTGGQKLGGHAVIVVGYDADGVWLVTWAQVIHMSWAMFARVVDEAWVGVLPEWFNDTSNRDPLGVDLYGLGEVLAALTGDPNPFQPSPQPTPSPVPPGPAPVSVDAADAALAADARPWLTRHHVGPNKVMAEGLQTWLAAKGLS